MPFTLRPSAQRGHANHGWLDTYHTFSFANYYDPAHMGFLDLRVINDDTVKAGAGFPTHGHDNMEILTYMVRGSLAHKDSTGSEGALKRGDIQAMSAGTGVTHSEFNASSSEDLRLLQIWIMPDRDGHKPEYRQAHISAADKKNQLRLIIGPQDAPLMIHQNARIYASMLDKGIKLEHRLQPGRGAWLQIVDGALAVNDVEMKSGDGLAVEAVDRLAITAQSGCEFLLFDLAA